MIILEKATPDETLTEEQKVQIDAIDRRFYRYYFQSVGIASVVFALVIVFIPYGNFITKSLVFGMAVYLGILSTSNWAMRSFTQRLSYEERKVIGQSGSPHPRSVLIINEGDVEKELLRASQPTETGNDLLRAATSSDTPQDQLLLSSRTTEEKCQAQRDLVVEID